MKVGHLICQDGAGEVLRCLDSMYPVVDEIYVVDGGSTDGTLEILERFKDAYNLTIFQNPFERMDTQRNFLLDKTKKNSWIVTIDQDEKLSHLATTSLRSFIDDIDDKAHETNSPLSIIVPLLNLSDNPKEMRTDNAYNSNKIFYYDEGLKFVEPYHARIAYDETRADYTTIEAPVGMAVLHYARLDKQRYDKWQADNDSGKREYEWKEWDPEAPTVKLDKIWW